MQKHLYYESLIQNNGWKTVAYASLNQHTEKIFSNLDYKKLLSNTIQSISIELRTETGQLVPFSGTGKVILTLKFKNLGE